MMALDLFSVFGMAGPLLIILAFQVVPIVGAFFIDLANAVVLTMFLSLDMMGLQ